MKRAGFVLVGGQSRRMGTNKALLPWKSGTLAEYVATQVEAAAGNAALVGTEEQRIATRFPFLLDQRPGYGPISGLHTALLSGRGVYNLVLACDMPQVNSAWLAELFAAAEENASGCAVAVDLDGRVHPLCAVYKSSALPVLEAAMNNGRLRVTDLATELNAVPVPCHEPLLNCNTPEQWAALRS